MPPGDEWAAVNSGPPDLYGAGDDYHAALVALERHGLNERHRAMLFAHLESPDHTATWADLAQAVGYDSGKIVNLQYGKVAHRIADELGVQDPPLADTFPGGWWGFVLSGWSRTRGTLGHTAYIMRPPLVEALQRLRIAAGSQKEARKSGKSSSTAEPPIGSNDDAVDLPRPPERVAAVVRRIVRDTSMVRGLKQRHRNTCQRCEKRLRVATSRFYSEGHHLQPLGAPHNGPDVSANILILCPDCHALFDLAAVAVNLKRLRQHPDHLVEARYVDYYNKLVRRPRDA